MKVSPAALWVKHTRSPSDGEVHAGLRTLQYDKECSVILYTFFLNKCTGDYAYMSRHSNAMGKPTWIWDNDNEVTHQNEHRQPLPAHNYGLDRLRPLAPSEDIIERDITRKTENRNKDGKERDYGSMPK